MTSKKIVCIFSALVLMLGSVGCGAAEPNQADTVAVAAAVDKFRACTSFSLVQLTEIDELVSAEGEEFSCNVLNKMEIELVAEPLFQMSTRSSALLEYDGEQMEQLTASYIVPENGGYAEYVSDGSDWYKLSTQEDVSLMGIGASSFVDTFFTDKIAFCRVGEENLNGEKAARYEGSLAKEDLFALLELNGQLSGISSMSENQQAKIKENLLKDLKGQTVTVWLNEEQGYPVRFEVDMTETLSAMEKSIARSLGNKASDEEVKLEKYTISMALGEFNALDEIVLPPEAAKAKPYEVE